MPFIALTQRQKLDKEGPSASQEPGDLCFLFYREIMRIWREEPRWKTISRIRRLYLTDPETNEFFLYVYDRVMNKFELEEVHNQAGLAYEVFFNKYGMEYEKIKEEENGTI